MRSRPATVRLPRTPTVRRPTQCCTRYIKSSITRLASAMPLPPRSAMCCRNCGELPLGNKVLEQLRADVLEANLELVRRGLVLYTFGNASAIDRSAGLVVIKPSGVAYDRMTAA